MSKRLQQDVEEKDEKIEELINTKVQLSKENSGLKLQLSELEQNDGL